MGSSLLARHKIYSTLDEKYTDLDILPLAALAHIFVTTEEIPKTVKLLSMRSGVIVLSSDDLFDILMSTWPNPPKPLTNTWIKLQLAASVAQVPKAV